MDTLHRFMIKLQIRASYKIFVLIIIILLFININIKKNLLTKTYKVIKILKTNTFGILSLIMQMIVKFK